MYHCQVAKLPRKSRRDMQRLIEFDCCHFSPRAPLPKIVSLCLNSGFSSTVFGPTPLLTHSIPRSGIELHNPERQHASEHPGGGIMDLFFSCYRVRREFAHGGRVRAVFG
jgi:hypothetical protein